MTRRWIIVTGFLLTMTAFSFGQNDWEGTATAGRYAEFPPGGMYAASNSFPLNSMVEITSVASGASARVIITSTVSDPGVFILLSTTAAESLGLSTGRSTVVRARTISLPGLTAVDPNQDLPFHPDPDINPAAAVGNPNAAIIAPFRPSAAAAPVSAVQPPAEEPAAPSAPASAPAVAAQPVVEVAPPADEPAEEPAAPSVPASAPAVATQPVAEVAPPADEPAEEPAAPSAPASAPATTPAVAIVRPPEPASVDTPATVPEVQPDLLPFRRAPQPVPPRVTLVLPLERIEETPEPAAEPDVEPDAEPEAVAPPIAAEEPAAEPAAEPDLALIDRPRQPPVGDLARNLPIVDSAFGTADVSTVTPRVPADSRPTIALPLVPVDTGLDAGGIIASPPSPQVTLTVTLVVPEDTVAPEIAMEGREAPPAASVAAVHEPDPTGSTGVVTGENDLKPSLIPHDAVISLEPAEYRTPEVPEPVTEDLEPTDSPAEEPQITQVAEPVLSDPETESEPEPEPEPEFEAPEGEVAAIEAPSPAVEAPAVEVAAIEAPAPAVEAPAVEAPADEDDPYLGLPVIRSLERESFYLQVAAFSNIRSVKATVETLGTTFPVAVLPQEDADRSMFRVFVGPLTEDEKGTALYAVRNKGFRDAFIREGRP